MANYSTVQQLFEIHLYLNFIPIFLIPKFVTTLFETCQTVFSTFAIFIIYNNVVSFMKKIKIKCKVIVELFKGIQKLSLEYPQDMVSKLIKF